MDLKLLLKRGALLAAANWPAVAIQFVAETTFQMLLAVPIIGAAILVAVLLGADLGELLAGHSARHLPTIASALMAEPGAFVAFVAAFAVVLLGGSILMFLVKGGIVDVLVAAHRAARPDRARTDHLRDLPQRADVHASAIRRRLRATVPALSGARPGADGGLRGLWRRLPGVTVYGYRRPRTARFVLGWTFIAAIAAVLLVVWITVVNLLYLLTQVAMVAVDDVGPADACVAVLRFIRAEFRELLGVAGVVLAMVVAATLVSALAWSGVGLIAFVPLVGLAVIPLQLAALLIRGLVFEYLGLTALGAYVTLYVSRVTLPDAVTARAELDSARLEAATRWARPAASPSRRWFRPRDRGSR